MQKKASLQEPEKEKVWKKNDKTVFWKHEKTQQKKLVDSRLVDAE